MKRSLVVMFGFLAVPGFLFAGSSTPAPTARREDRSESRRHADAVIERWIHSLGGASALKKLQTIHTDERLGDKGHALLLILSADETLDGRYHFDLTGGGSLRGGYDGKHGWYDSHTLGFGFVPPSDFHAWIWRSTALVARDVRSSYPKIEYSGATLVVKSLWDVLLMERADCFADAWSFD